MRIPIQTIRRIWALYQKGERAQEIAENLRQARWLVELVLSMSPPAPAPARSGDEGGEGNDEEGER